MLRFAELQFAELQFAELQFAELQFAGRLAFQLGFGFLREHYAR